MAFDAEKADNDGGRIPDPPSPPSDDSLGRSEPVRQGREQDMQPSSSGDLKEEKVRAEAQFIDFDVWVGTLEANFGLDFEKVLTRAFGPDWLNMINARIAAGEDFSAVVQELRYKLGGPSKIERDDSDLDSGGITFEALGRAEVIGEPGHGSLDEEQDEDNSLLLRARRKEMLGEDKLRVDSQPDRYQEETLLLYKDKEKEQKSAEDEMILMDRKDFSRLSYYASKEMGRLGKDKLKDRASRKGDWWKMGPQAGPWARTFLILGALFLLWVLFSLGSYIYFTSTSGRLINAYPPDLAFRPSTALHKQGVLAAVNPDSSETPLLFFFYRPTILRLEVNMLSSQGQRRYDLSIARSGLLVIPHSPERDSVAVVAHYSQRLPLALPALLGWPLFSLDIDGVTTLQAFETPASAIFPGLIFLELRGPQNETLGQAYLARNRLNIHWDDRSGLSGASVDKLASRLMLLFTLLDI
ncbi:hypothetical protein LLH00_14475 [bacterium]|nr:hypothetical protein [bacterium]